MNFNAVQVVQNIETSFTPSEGKAIQGSLEKIFTTENPKNHPALAKFLQGLTQSLTGQKPKKASKSKSPTGKGPGRPKMTQEQKDAAALLRKEKKDREAREAAAALEAAPPVEEPTPEIELAGSKPRRNRKPATV